MPEKHPDEPFDEQVIEISDLPEEKQQSRTQKVSSVRRVSPGPRLSLRQRRQQVVLTIGIILLVLLIFLSSISSVRTTALSTLFPSPTSTPISGDNLFYFPNLPSWGHATLDDKPLAHLPAISDGLPLKIARGAHLLEWRAEPFRPLSCTLLVPPAQGVQTCVTRPLIDPDSSVHKATLVGFPTSVSLSLLPQYQQQSLTQAVQRLLDTFEASDIVQPGQLYLQSVENTTDNAIRTATLPLRAQQRFLLETDTTIPALCTGVTFDRSCFIADQDCRLFCTVQWPGDAAVPAPPRWDVAIVIRPYWTYSSLESGAVIQEVRGSQQLVALLIGWEQGSWHVSFHPQGASTFDDPNCITTIGTLARDPDYKLASRIPVPLHWAYFSGQKRAQGCVAVPLSDDPGQYPVFSISSSALVMQRFGVLLAANELAARLWPQLPHATAEEQNIAKNIISNPAFVS